MTSTNLPVTVDQARQWLASTDSLEDVGSLYDLAEAARRYATSHKAQNYAAEVKLRAARRGGELLRDVPRTRAGRKPNNSSPPVTDLQDAQEQAGIDHNSAHKWQKLAGIDAGSFEAWLVEMTANDGELTLAAALRKAQGAHVQHNAGTQEWYTPPEIIEAAQRVMGAIDLDPASSAEAQRIVQAEQFYTEDDNGLSKEWKGRVWLNPPYRQPLIQQFIAKLVTEYLTGAVTAAITLTNNATETDWGQALLRRSNAVCFPDGRIRFWAPGKQSASPLQGQMICYLGAEKKKFTAEFKGMGIVL